MTGQDIDLNKWDDFTGSNFLSPDDVKSDDDRFVCVDVELDRENARPILILEHNEISKKFSLNVTNSNFLKEKNVSSPKAMIGKMITFRKVFVNNPQTKKEVEALRIKSVN